MSATLLAAGRSHAALAVGNALRRLPRAPGRERPQAFHDAFDDRTLFYDCFRYRDGRILLVGPPPMNLRPALRAARFVAQPSGAVLRPSFHASLSVMITALAEAPAGTERITVSIAGETLTLAVQPDVTGALAGRRLLFSVNKNNELGWIREWALWHARAHGTDAVVLFDNGSTRYGTEEIAATLADVPGIAAVAVPSWPVKFGPIDPAVTANPYWARFFQISTMSVALRRYGMGAAGLINCDIDELAGTHSGASLYDLARQSRGGLVVFRGTWIEATGEGTRHRDYAERLADAKAALSPQRKWALDPGRAWVKRLGVHPYWHWIEGRPLGAKSMPQDATYWHFKGINTNWKTRRAAAPTGATVADAPLATAMRRVGLVTDRARR